MNGKFFTLPEEKQKRIINAAYVVFANSSYKKASMSRIAAAGGISKSLLFHYFQNKKELYLYLWENINRISCEIELKYYRETTDFFEIMTQKILARCEFMRTAPDEYLFSIGPFLRNLWKSGRQPGSHIKKYMKMQQVSCWGPWTFPCSARVLTWECCWRRLTAICFTVSGRCFQPGSWTRTAWKGIF